MFRGQHWTVTCSGASPSCGGRWEWRVMPDLGNQIREYLDELVPDLSIFSIGQVIGEYVYEDDFRREFGHIDRAAG